MKKPRFLDNFVENEVFYLLKSVAAQRVFLFYVESTEKMIFEIMRNAYRTQPKMRRLYRKITSQTFFQIRREYDNLGLRAVVRC